LLNLPEELISLNDGIVTFGIVGPARSGKSLFLQKFSSFLLGDKLHENTLPMVESGRSITTLQTTFIPKEPVTININSESQLSLQFIECVGYKIHGVKGLKNERVYIQGYKGSVNVPTAIAIQMREAINSFCQYSFVIITDGSIGDFPRFSYIDAEKDILRDSKHLEKPFIVVLNTVEPDADHVCTLKKQIEREYNVIVIPCDVSKVSSEEMSKMLNELIDAYPIKEVNVNIPAEVMQYQETHPKRELYTNTVKEVAKRLSTFRSINGVLELFSSYDFIEKAELSFADKKSGIISIDIFENKNDILVKNNG
jgi:stage IV sporulation protein A